MIPILWESCWSPCGLICQFPPCFDVFHALAPKLGSFCCIYRVGIEVPHSSTLALIIVLCETDSFESWLTVRVDHNCLVFLCLTSKFLACDVKWSLFLREILLHVSLGSLKFLFLSINICSWVLFNQLRKQILTENDVGHLEWGFRHNDLIPMKQITPNNNNNIICNNQLEWDIV